MYEAFYGLRERPFNLTPDPKYLYLSEKHKEAFAHLLYGIKNRSGFVMITGEIGTGKTTLCRNLLNQLDADTELAFIFNPFLNSIELMKKINQEFGIESQADTVLSLTEELNVHLLHSTAHGKSCVLVIDEAQNLSPQVLEQIRLLSNIETDTQKLLQIILIGQPELAEKLELQELRQLNQRITARYHLKPLNALETLQYIAYRIHVAGGRKRINFTKRAVKQVYKLSGGVPRMINAICDRALLIGYTKEQRVINVRLVRKAAREIRGEKVTAPKNKRFSWRRWLPAPSLAALLLLIFGLAYYLVEPLDRFARELSLFNNILSGELPGGDRDDAGRGGPMVTAESLDADVPAAGATAEANGALHLVMERLNASGAVRPSQSLAPVVEALKPEEALRAGMDTLVSLWNKDLLDNYPEANSPEALAACFKGQGLDCESLSPGLEQLAAINLPGLAKMTSNGNTFWMALVRMDDRTVTLLAAPNKRVTVSHDDFNQYYGRELLVPWQDPAPNDPIIGPGQRGPKVLALKEQLREMGRLEPGNTDDIYDRATEDAIRAIQSEAGLNADGKVGRQVRLALSGCEGGSPTLRPGNNPAALIKNAGEGRSAGKTAKAVAPAAATKPRVAQAKKITPAPAPSDTKKTDADQNFKAIEETAPVMHEIVAAQPPVLATTDREPAPAVETPGPESFDDTKAVSANEPGLLAQPGGLTGSGETPAIEAVPETAEEGIMQVRELPDPGLGTEPAAPQNSEASVTPPVLGSMPLVPHVEASAQ